MREGQESVVEWSIARSVRAKMNKGPRIASGLDRMCQ